MHAKSFVLALALASSSVVEANRPRIYYPRQVKREVENNAPAPVLPENPAVPTLEKRDPQGSFLDRLFNNNNENQAAAADKEDGINFDPTLPLGFKRPGPSASAPPALVLQPTTSMAIEEPETTEPAETTDAPTEADTGILLAPSGIVTSKTAVTSDVNTKPATTEQPKEQTKPAATTAPAVKEPESAKTSEKKPVESKTEQPAPVQTQPKVETESPVVETKEPETEAPASTPAKKPAVETKTEKAAPVESKIESKTEEPVPVQTETQPQEETQPSAVPTSKKGLLDPVESLLSSVLPVPAESKTTAPKPVNTETKAEPATSDDKEETQPAPIETETVQPAPVETQSAQPADSDSETKSPSIENPAPTTKEGLLDPVETLLSSVLPVPVDSETKNPQPDQTESGSIPEETETPTKEPQRQESKPQTDGQTLPTLSPPTDEATAAPGTVETSKDGLLDPVETLLSSLLPNEPSEVKTTSPEETSAPESVPVDIQPTSAAANDSDAQQTVSGAPLTDPETTGLPDIIPTGILPDTTLPIDETDILPIPTDITDVTSALPEPSSPVTVSPVIPTTAAPEESQTGSPDLTSFLDPNTKFPQTPGSEPTESPNATVPDATSGVGSQPVETELPVATSEPVNGTQTDPAVTGEPETTGAPEPTEVNTEDVTEAPTDVPTAAPTATGDSSEEPSGNATEPVTEPATKPIDTATGSVPTELPATQTDAETNGTATEEPTSPATQVETESAPVATDGEETSAAAPTFTDEQPSVQPTSQPPVETETQPQTQPEPAPTTLVPTAADPITSIRPTATLTNTNNWLPTTIMFEPTSIPAAPTQATETSTSTGLPANIPRVILPNDPNKPVPEGSRAIQIGFLFPFNYKFLARNTVAAAQLFKYLPKGLADAGGFSKDRILVEKIVPMDTQSQWGYITALAKIHYPENMLDSLQADLMTPNSLLYNNDLEIVRNLTSVINNKIDIFGNTDNDSNSDSGDSDDGGSSNNDGFGNSGEGDKTAKQKATTAGIAVGAVGLSVMYGAAMFLVARRYKRKKQLGHRRASSIGSSQRSSEMQYGGNGSPALMGGALMSRDFSSYGAQGEHPPVRPGGRDSHGSGRSGMGNSARTAFISAPVAAENSLGWN